MAEPSRISLEAEVVVISEQVSVELTDEAVVLSLRDGVYYGLNDVAARIWELIQEPREVAEVCRVLEGEYEVEAAQCERETLVLLEQLLEWGLLDVRDADAAGRGDDPGP